MTPLTKTSSDKWILLTVVSVIVFSACQKKIDQPSKQKEYSSEAVLKWLDMQLRVIRTTVGMPPPTNSRLFAYLGIALYESVVPGMPGYQSFAGQLTELPAMPQLHGEGFP